MLCRGVQHSSDQELVERESNPTALEISNAEGDRLCGGATESVGDGMASEDERIEAAPSCSICLENFGTSWSGVDMHCLTDSWKKTAWSRLRFLRPCKMKRLPFLTPFRYTSPIEQGAIVVAKCHSYHRDCILEWMERKGDCPDCRQAMWDPDAYDLIYSEIQRTAAAIEDQGKESSSDSRIDAV